MRKTIDLIIKSFTSITLLSCDVSSSREDYLYCEGKYSEDPAYCSKISNIKKNSTKTSVHYGRTCDTRRRYYGVSWLHEHLFHNLASRSAQRTKSVGKRR